jgi:hypothetical protein
MEAGRSKLILGIANIKSEITQESEVLSFGALHIGDHLMNCGVRTYESEQDHALLKQEAIAPFDRAEFPEVLRILDRHFGESTYSLRSIFHDDQRRILDTILNATLSQAEGMYRQIYETHAPMMRFVTDLRVPLPRPFSIAAEFALNSSLRAALKDFENLDFARIRALLDEARSQGVILDAATLGFALRKTIRRLGEQFVGDPENIELMKTLEAAAGLARSLPFEVNFWRTQNNFYQMLQKRYPEHLEKANEGDAQAREWVEHFAQLGKNLSVKVTLPAMPLRAAS